MAAPHGVPALPPPPVPASGWRGAPATRSPIPAAATSDGVSPVQMARLRQAAQDFEAMALGQLLEPMFDTVHSAHTAFGGGSAEAAFRPMLVEAIAKQVAAHGGLGIAAPVYASLLRAQESAARETTPGGATQ